MSAGRVRLMALVWTLAAVLQAASLVVRLQSGQGGWVLWVSFVLLALWLFGAAGYWLLIWRRRAVAAASAPTACACGGCGTAHAA